MRFETPIIGLLALLPAAAFADGVGVAAADPVVLQPIETPTGSGNVLRFTAGAGLQTRPGYFGSDEMVFGPTGTFRFEYLKFGDIELGTADPNAVASGLSFGGSLRFIGDRTAEDYPELAGLEDLDLSLELGGGVTYSQPGFEVFGDVRFGVLGHEAWVGEVGADVFLRPNDRLTLSAGPRVFWGSDDYAAYYFSTDPDATSTLDAFEAQGGVLSAGIEFGADYAITDDWGIEGRVRYDRFLGDAADSPIVTGGSDDGVSASIMATRRFTLDF